MLRESSIEATSGTRSLRPHDPERRRRRLHARRSNNRVAPDSFGVQRAHHSSLAQPSNNPLPNSGHSIPSSTTLSPSAASSFCWSLSSPVSACSSPRSESTASSSLFRHPEDPGNRRAHGLGASVLRVRRDVLWQTMRLALAGLSLGLIASLGAARLVASLLFATSPWDPVTFACMVLVLLFIALLAGYIPAHRASRIQPMAALRNN